MASKLWEEKKKNCCFFVAWIIKLSLKDYKNVLPAHQKPRVKEELLLIGRVGWWKVWRSRETRALSLEQQGGNKNKLLGDLFLDPVSPPRLVSPTWRQGILVMVWFASSWPTKRKKNSNTHIGSYYSAKGRAQGPTIYSCAGRKKKKFGARKAGWKLLGGVRLFRLFLD